MKTETRKLLVISLAVTLLSCAAAAVSFARDWSFLVAKPMPAKVSSLRHASMLLAYGDPVAQPAYLACVQDAVKQGFAPQTAALDCATNLMEDVAQGLGGETIPGFDEAANHFDPGSIVAACASGDPAVSQTGSTNWKKEPVHQYAWSTVQPDKIILDMDKNPVSEYGNFSFGGDPSKGVDKDGGSLEKGEDVYHYQGMSPEESKKAKEESVGKAEAAKAEWKDAEAAAKADPKNKDKQDKAGKAFLKYLTASEEASKDPNLKPHSNSRTVGDSSVCEEVMQTAREMLRECNRNGWKSSGCQVLHARMHGCPNPTQILIDPDAGYVCAAEIDPKAVADAAQMRCEQLTTPGPDGGTPCVPPKVSENGGYIDGEESGDVCADPRAYVDPESGICVRQMELHPFGQPDINGIIQICLGKFGGPVINIPTTNPPPKSLFPL